MKKIARILVMVAAMALAVMSIQATASAQDYTPNNPTVRAVYSPFRGEAPQVVDNAFGFGGINALPGDGAAAGGGTTGGGTGGTGGGLAHTGNEVTAPIAAAAALICGGGLIVLASRDRD